MANDQDGGGCLGQPDGEREIAITLVMSCWDINQVEWVVEKRGRGGRDQPIRGHSGGQKRYGGTRKSINTRV